MCIYSVYTLCISFSLGQTALLLLFCLMMNLFEGHFFPMNEGFHTYPFHVKWVFFPEESCTVKTSQVVTHLMFISKSLIEKLNFADCICNLLICVMKFGWCHPLHCWNEILCFCWLQYGQCKNRTIMAEQTSYVL